MKKTNFHSKPWLLRQWATLKAVFRSPKAKVVPLAKVVPFDPKDEQPPVSQKDSVSSEDLRDVLADIEAMVHAYRNKPTSELNVLKHGVYTVPEAFDQWLKKVRSDLQATKDAKSRSLAIKTFLDGVPPHDAFYSFDKPLPIIFRQRNEVFIQGINYPLIGNVLTKNPEEHLWWQVVDNRSPRAQVLLAIAQQVAALVQLPGALKFCYLVNEQTTNHEHKKAKRSQRSQRT